MLPAKCKWLHFSWPTLYALGLPLTMTKSLHCVTRQPIHDLVPFLGFLRCAVTITVDYRSFSLSIYHIEVLWQRAPISTVFGYVL